MQENKNDGFGKKLLKVIAVALVFGLVAGGTFAGVNYGVSKATGAKAETEESDAKESGGVSYATSKNSINSTSTSSAVTVTDVSDIVDNVMPAIVAVTNNATVNYRSVFGFQTYNSESEGSGIIIAQDDSKIYIATNNHVVSGADSLKITFVDEQEAAASIVGVSSDADLAVVSVELSDLSDETKNAIKTATIGDSSDLKVGQSSIVIGNSLGYGQTVTAGIISALEREVTIKDDDGNLVTNNLIQTDAAINPGNSGGALLDMNGKVIGIVSAKYADTDVEGVGYVIPISQAYEIIEKIITTGNTKSDKSDSEKSTQSGYLGISGVDLDRTTAIGYGIPAGVYVTKVYSGSGAAAAGVSKGDVITAFEGKSISSMEELQGYVSKYTKGDKVEISVADSDNDYEVSTVTVTLGESPQ